MIISSVRRQQSPSDHCDEVKSTGAATSNLDEVLVICNDPHNCVNGMVKGIAYMGNLSIYLVQLDSGKQIKVTMSNQVRATELMIDCDDRVSVTWHANSPVALLS